MDEVEERCHVPRGMARRTWWTEEVETESKSAASVEGAGGVRMTRRGQRETLYGIEMNMYKRVHGAESDIYYRHNNGLFTTWDLGTLAINDDYIGCEYCLCNEWMCKIKRTLMMMTRER